MERWDLIREEKAKWLEAGLLGQTDRDLSLWSLVTLLSMKSTLSLSRKFRRKRSSFRYFRINSSSFTTRNLVNFQSKCLVVYLKLVLPISLIQCSWTLTIQASFLSSVSLLLWRVSVGISCFWRRRNWSVCVLYSSSRMPITRKLRKNSRKTTWGRIYYSLKRKCKSRKSHSIYKEWVSFHWFVFW